MSLKQVISEICSQALEAVIGKAQNKVSITPATSSKFGHYQCNSCMGLGKLLNTNPIELAKKVKQHIELEENKIFEKIEVAGPGFLNFTIAKPYMVEKLIADYHKPNLGIIEANEKKHVVIDFSSPNIAKEMHVGHLRSTIIGECLANLLEIKGHRVTRVNHLGDWGTQFGMLICYIQAKYQNIQDCDLLLSDLVVMYRAAKEKFDNDPEFKLAAQQAVVKLQNFDPESIAIWQKICEISRRGFAEIYQLLGIELIERGESFYNQYLPGIIRKLEERDLITISEQAKCVYLPGFINKEGDPLPLIVQKQDGGYNYATTDLAAIHYRVNQDKANWIIYVVDAGQAQHFNMVFTTAKLSGIVNDSVKLQHIPFGLVLRQDGKKFKTRSGDTERLIDLLNTAIEKAKLAFLQRNPDSATDELEDQAKVLGINAVKYADLSTNRTSNYTFSYERMLQFEGNTAAFLLYAYVRISSIKKSLENLTINHKHLTINMEEEADLALHILQLNETIDAACDELLPNRLTDYLHKLAEKFHVFFHKCRVIGDPMEKSRLILCDMTAKALEIGFKLIGLQTLDKM